MADSTKPKKNLGTLPWEKDEATYPTVTTDCKVCGRHGPMKLAWDKRGYLCLHAGKCIARAARVRAGLSVDDEAGES